MSNYKIFLLILVTTFTLSVDAQNSNKEVANFYLEMTLKADESDRFIAKEIFTKIQEYFTQNVEGAVSMELRMREEDVQVIQGFRTKADAELFNKEVLIPLKSSLNNRLDIKIYEVLRTNAETPKVVGFETPKTN